MLKHLLILPLILVLLSCSKVTEDNFTKITTGMSYAQVTKILGDPTKTQSLKIMEFAATNATWKHKGRVISIQFLDDKVKMKSFVDESDKKS